jgi:hypothetical protein
VAPPREWRRRANGAAATPARATGGLAPAAGGKEMDRAPSFEATLRGLPPSIDSGRAIPQRLQVTA